MRRFLGSALGVLVVGGGCVTSTTGSTSTSRPSPQSAYRTAQSGGVGVIDSAYAQAFADREGPGVTINVQFSNVSGARRARAMFHLQDDAYVVVGHIDADGVVRITFPLDPRDDGFARGNSSYQTSEFFAGFVDQYRYRYTSRMMRPTSASYDSYDGGMGYVFVIASWRPMNFSRFSTSGVWDSFELTDAQYINDPRPAIYELASLLAGENREAYTVKFARFTGSSGLYGNSYNGLASSSIGANYCYGASPYGFASSALNSMFGLMSPSVMYGQSFWHRGSRYFYDATGDCYYQSGLGGYWNQPRGYINIAGGPPPQQPTRPRVFDVDGRHSQPEPKGLPGYRMPLDAVGRAGEPASEEAAPKASPAYRNRGLITADNPRVGIGTRGPIDERARPSIEQMMNRRDPPSRPSDGNGAQTSRATQRDRERSQPSEPFNRGQVRQAQQSSGDQQSNRSGQQRGTDEPRQQPQRPVSADNNPRSGGGGGEQRAAPRVAAPAGDGGARSAPPAARPSAPAPTPPPAPAPSPPASSSSGSSSSGSSGSSSGGPVRPPVPPVP